MFMIRLCIAALACFAVFSPTSSAQTPVNGKVKFTFKTLTGKYPDGFEFRFYLRMDGIDDPIKKTFEVAACTTTEDAASAFAAHVKGCLENEGGLSMAEACKRVWVKNNTVKVKQVKKGGVSNQQEGKEIVATAYGGAKDYLLAGDGDAKMELFREWPVPSLDGGLMIIVGGVDSMGMYHVDQFDLDIPAGLQPADVDTLVYTALTADGWSVVLLPASEFLLTSSPQIGDIHWVRTEARGDPSFETGSMAQR